VNNYEMSSNVIELSEHKTYIELTRRLCYYDYPNLNGVQLNSDTAEERAQTLLMQPVVAKYKKFQNKDDLGGHECSVDSKGNVTFGTVPIGVNVSVEIKKDTVSINDNAVETPCLFATSRIWTRNKNVCSAIKRLFAEGKLHSSWEILSEKVEYTDNVKILKDYVFEADALLGSTSNPAYGECATTLCVASTDDPELLLSEAIANDFNIENSETKEDKTLDIKENESIATSETENVNTITNEVTETSETEVNTENKETNIENSETVEVSALTDRDIRCKIEKLCRDKLRYCWVAFMFPAENYVLVEYDGRESELEYMKFTYAVNGDDVTISEPEKVRLAVSVANINSEISEKNDVIIKANEKITSLKAEVENLAKYKEMFEKAELEKAEKELAEKQENLKKYAVKSGYITLDEVETSEEIKKLIDAVDENGIKAIIVDRLMAQKNDTVNTSEVAETKTTEIASLTCDDAVDTSDYKSVMKKFLGK
jgi:hypothetical protein